MFVHFAQSQVLWKMSSYSEDDGVGVQEREKESTMMKGLVLSSQGKKPAKYITKKGLLCIIYKNLEKKKPIKP